jgi:GrpB-like predicted nucleotidyltransferase (UPF0157 family)
VTLHFASRLLASMRTPARTMPRRSRLSAGLYRKGKGCEVGKLATMRVNFGLLRQTLRLLATNSVAADLHVGERGSRSTMSTPLRLMEHNQQWEQEFNQSRSMLLWATEGWLHDVQHIGSTSIQGGIAQPVIDMMAGMSDLKGLNEACTLIEGLNYARVASPDWCADELTALLQKPRAGSLTHTVLVVRLDGSSWRRGLAIREWLASNLVDWQNLQNLKRDRFTTGCDAAERYAAAKNDFFAELELRMASSEER